MTEAEFWTALEFRVSRALEELADNRLRFLWCDGFFPDDRQPNGDSMVGYTLISENDGKTFERYRFRLWLSAASQTEAGTNWDTAIPALSSTGWLRVDRDQKTIEVRP